MLRHCTVFLFVAASCSSLVGQDVWPVDSLLKTWPTQQRVEESKSRNRATSNVRTTGLYTDLKRTAPALPVFIDPVVDELVKRFSSTQRDHFRALLGASEQYLPMIERELAKRSMPNELKYLPFAISAMNPQANSNEGEAGLWMLSYPVAKRYGLRVDRNVDERRDPTKSTIAALRSLQELHQLYGAWPKAVIAFTCGPANLTRAIRRNGGNEDVRSLYTHLSPSHRGVLPRLIAFAFLSISAEEADIDPLAWRSHEPSDTVRYDSALVIAALTRVVGTTPARFAALNPTLIATTITAGQPFLLPHSEAERFKDLAFVVLEAQNSKPRRPDTTPAPMDSVERLPDGREAILYRIEEGDCLGCIADRFKVGLSELRSWNELKGDNIDVGNTLVVYVASPVRDQYEGTVSGTKADTTIVAPRAETIAARPKPQRPLNTDHTWYTVKSGDSLYLIAKRYTGISAEELMRYNGIGAGIRPGQRIKIPRP